MLHLYEARLLSQEHPHLLFADQIEPRFVHIDCVETKLERLAIASDVMEEEVHPAHLVVKRKA